MLNLLQNFLFCAKTSYLSCNLFCSFGGLDKQTSIQICIFFLHKWHWCGLYIVGCLENNIPMEKDRNLNILARLLKEHLISVQVRNTANETYLGVK